MAVLHAPLEAGLWRVEDLDCSHPFVLIMKLCYHIMFHFSRVRNARLPLASVYPQPLITMLLLLLSLLLLLLLQKFSQNELYAAHWIESAIHHACHSKSEVDLGAEKALSSLLNNERLLTDVITDDIVAVFLSLVVDRVRARGQSSHSPAVM